ncbi:hypothetical protein TWF281_001570 [Arthrobotrys megalospora]
MESLATEILLQIFSDDALMSCDLASCARTCRRFSETAPHCKIKHTFRIVPTHIGSEADTHGALKLVRRLLEAPEIGERFQHIEVRWTDPLSPSEDSPPEQTWSWTVEENKKIEEICTRWNIVDNLPTISTPRNAEDLLPLLFCLTPRLESFAHHNTPWTNPSSPRGPVNPSWFYAALRRSPLLPGLANIKTLLFSGYMGRKGLRGMFLSDVALLPGLESMEIRDSNASPPQLRMTSGDGAVKVTSSLKHLKIINCSFIDREYRDLACDITSLESLCIEGCSAEDPARVMGFFLQSSGKTLTRDRISITVATTNVV